MLASSNCLLRLLRSSSTRGPSYRVLSTGQLRMVPILSENYQVKDKWMDRFNTELLRNVEPNKYFSDLLTRLNNGAPLHATDVDIFIQVAKPNEHLEEAVYLFRQIRSTQKSVTMLPSTHHAMCRFFLENGHLAALVSMLESRVTFGLFPDFMAINLMLDATIDKQFYNLGSRIAACVMFQEEFGLNPILDKLSFYSLIKYINADKDFSNWMANDGQLGLEEILGGIADQSSSVTQKKEEEQKKEDEAKNEEEEEDEEEEDAQYIRVPFLRNEYFDNHFDLKEPRMIYGKTLLMLGKQLKDESHSKSAQLLGHILFGSWEKACDLLDSMQEQTSILLSKDAPEKCNYYITNLHNLKPPSDELKDRLVSKLGKITNIGGSTLENMAEEATRDVAELEGDDTAQLVKLFDDWTKDRSEAMKKQMSHIVRLKRIEEIKKKKRELRDREKFLYFYDNLKKSKITRINYE